MCSRNIHDAHVEDDDSATISPPLTASTVSEDSKGTILKEPVSVDGDADTKRNAQKAAWLAKHQHDLPAEAWHTNIHCIVCLTCYICM